VAYRQPVTRPEIEAIRGVNSDGVLRTLLNKGLVEEVGRLDTVGHPSQFGTTFEFLRYFGLEKIEDLPELDLPVRGQDDAGDEIKIANVTGSAVEEVSGQPEQQES
jgi:segregation and condensation protein B